MIAPDREQQKLHLELGALAAELVVQPQTLRQRISCGSRIAVKRGSILYSHSRLDLTERRSHLGVV